YVDISTTLVDEMLVKIDRMTMSHSIEGRVPFLDHELVEYVLNVPDRFKEPLTPKKLLTDSVGSLIPSEIIDRPKMGFTFPWSEWLRADLKIYCEERLSFLKSSEYFRAEEIDKLWKDFLNNDPHVTWARIWILVVLGNWMRNNQIE
ncbi:MAG: asparagine synthetase B, partial [Flavobacteriales bacterium]|nr:asparagine synthetase B [Flavobacteriales bacterium]